MDSSSDSPKPTPSQIVLCFDGTGNTFRADGTETNILRICRMLARSDRQLIYYQPGIGTEITAGSLAGMTLKKSSRLGKSKTLSQALGKSFDQHVLGGYRFLMRHCRSDSEIFIFGFSRGAYTARFLAEMVDYTGLLGPDNEEMTPFIWEAFSKWKLARYNKPEQKKHAFEFMRHCRITLCRPCPQVKFLGMFDTVNSVADFEINNDIFPTARVMRHAVSIEERRVKFQPVLLQERQKTSAKPEDRQKHKMAVPAIEKDKPGQNTGGGLRGSRRRRRAGLAGGLLSYAPLVWMVHEARRAGLELDERKMREALCVEGDNADDGDKLRFQAALLESSVKGQINDRLDFGQGFSIASVLAWRLMEYLPLRWFGMQPDGSWKWFHWSLHRGDLRDIPDNAMLHVSVIRRMQGNTDYRPGSVIVGGGGRGVRKAPPQYGMGEWVVAANQGDPVNELWTRKRREIMQS